MSKSTGDMYDWVTRTWNPVGGECPINCPYCYVKDLKRFPNMAKKYSGEPRLTGPWPRFTKGEVVFVCDCTDLFAMRDDLIAPVLQHCRKWPTAQYVFQSKEPWHKDEYYGELPPKSLLGTTIETDLESDEYAGAEGRFNGIAYIRGDLKTFITVEPIMRFSRNFAASIIAARPSFVNIGADSGNNHLPEPTKAETLQLIADLRAAGIEVRIKRNLERIIGKQA